MWETIIPAAAAIIGGLISKSGQEDTNATNQALAQQQMAFQQQQTSSSYQRGVLDMQAAGLNPMLAYSQGGAASGSGAMAQMQNPNIGLGQGIAAAGQGANILSASMGVAKDAASIDQMGAQTEKIRSETLDQGLHSAQLLANIRATGASASRTEEETLPNIMHSQKMVEDILGARFGALSSAQRYEAMKQGGFEADVRERKARATLAEQEIPRSAAESRMYQRPGGDVIPYIGTLMEMVRGISSAKRAFSPSSGGGMPSAAPSIPESVYHIR